MRVGLPLYGTKDCDPGERRRFDAIAEAYWLAALTDVLDRTVLFVCGADHVASFSPLLHERVSPPGSCGEYFGKEVYRQQAIAPKQARHNPQPLPAGHGDHANKAARAGARAVSARS